MAARAVTRRYDAYLRPHGLTSAQFSLLATLTLVGDQTVSQLAEARGFERTTLTRNLDRLQQMELIASRQADKGNGRICGITAKGETLIQQLLPLWRQAQAEMNERLTASGFEDSLRVLKRLAAL
jgi:DNA-binding MarR family transcriptional regulator